jgi:hypothetical protein
MMKINLSRWCNRRSAKKTSLEIGAAMPALCRTSASDRAACLPWVFPDAGLRDREVSFTPKDRHRQPSLSGPAHASKLSGAAGHGRLPRWVLNGPDCPEIRLPLFPQKRTQVSHRTMSGSCQNRTFVAGFLAITSNARHAERSNDRRPALPHRPRPSRSTASAGSPT